jgi:hypothetical protein
VRLFSANWAKNVLIMPGELIKTVLVNQVLDVARHSHYLLICFERHNADRAFSHGSERNLKKQSATQAKSNLLDQRFLDKNPFLFSLLLSFNAFSQNLIRLK